jgi:hypothetical protein
MVDKINVGDFYYPFPIIVHYHSLGLVSTLTKLIVIYFQKMNSFNF